MNSIFIKEVVTFKRRGCSYEQPYFYCTNNQEIDINLNTNPCKISKSTSVLMDRFH